MPRRLFHLFRRPPVPFDALRWERAAAEQRVLVTLDSTSRRRLWALAQEFLRNCTIQPVGGLTLGEDERLRIALLASLPVLELGLGWYRGLREVVVYPAAFAPLHTWQDAAGVVHSERRPESGEAWDEGLLILSWADVQASGALDGYHVVLHECGHWLDMQAGSANGRPPLHAGMSGAAWSEAFSRAYESFRREPQHYPGMRPYGAEAPAEFFAVACESFFERPHALAREFPEVYAQLRALLRQDPRRRIPDKEVAE